METADSVLGRVEDQIGWYDKKSHYNQQLFKLLKVIQIVAAAAIPVGVGAGAPDLLAAILGGGIVVVEGLQQLNQYQQNWTDYRSTSEALKHERFLYLAHAGPYAGTGDRHAILAERAEGLISQEHAKWVSSREDVAKGQPSG